MADATPVTAPTVAATVAPDAPALTNAELVSEVKPTETKAESVKPPAPEMFEVTIDGKKQTLTREQMILKAQKAHAADLRFDQADKTRKQTEALLDQLAAQPEATLERLGIDLDELAEKRMALKAQRALMTEEQRKQMDLEAKVAKYEKEEKARLEAQQQTQQQQQDQVTYAQLEKELLAASEKHQLSNDPSTLEELCDIAIEAIDLGYNLTADQVALEYLERQDKFLKTRDAKMMSKMDGAKLAEYLGPEKLKLLMEHSLKAHAATPPPKAEVVEEKPTTKRNGYISMAQYEKERARRR
jgi:hypothetical protein